MSSLVFRPIRFTSLLWLVLMSVLATACGSPAKGDGPGSFRALGNAPAHTVRDLPRSRSGNAAQYTVFGKQYEVLDTAKDFSEKGIASWYGSKFHGRATASGELYNMYDMTAAHKNLPLPVYVRVTNLDNGQELIVKVNDRGPFVDGRVIDLSFAAAKKLGVYETGTANVEIVALSEAYREGELQVARKPAESTSENPVEPAKPATTDQVWVVQLGAFKEAENANSLIARLNADLVAQTLIKHDRQSALYRVLVGPVDTFGAADRLRLTLAEKGIDGYTLQARVQ